MATKTSFSWKRKRSENITKVRLSPFTEDEGTEETFVDDWRALVKRNKNINCLEDKIAKSTRLKNEGVALAEMERYWEAINKWNEAIHLTPEDATLYEMKAQVLLELDEIFPSIQAAEMAVSLNPHCYETFQTLGRAQLGIGEIDMAVKSFCKALHIRPDVEELWREDLGWATDLRRERSTIDTDS